MKVQRNGRVLLLEQQQLFQNGPKLGLPQRVHVVIVVPKVALPGGVHPRRGASEQLGHRNPGRAGQVEAHGVVDLLEPGEGVLGILNLVAPVDQLHAEIGLHHALGLHHVPEPPLLLPGRNGKELVQVLHLHGVHVGPEGERGHVGGHVVMLNHIIV